MMSSLSVSKKIFFFRSYLLDGDSRAQKAIKDYEEMGYAVQKVVWTRGRVGKPDANTIAYAGKGHLGGRLRNLYYFVRWHLFMMATLYRLRNDDFIVHCVDFDTAVVCLPTAKLFKKAVVFDCFDHFASSRDLKGTLFRVFSNLEKWLCRSADLCIFPDEARVSQYGLTKAEAQAKACIVGNIPAVERVLVEHDGEEDVNTDYESALRICYVGTLEATHRGLEFIPELCRLLGNKVQFTVAGIGELDNFFIEKSAHIPNLTYLGSLTYEDALQVMHQADILYGPYLLSSPNHAFASPNKMYEHMLLGKCLLTNVGTPVAHFVESNRTGILFDGTVEDLTKLLARLSREECAEAGCRAAARWRDEYSSLRERQVDGFFEKLAGVIRKQ